MSAQVNPSLPRLALTVLCLCGLLAAPVAAQKVGRDYYEDKQFGYKVKYPKDWTAIPVKPELRQSGVAARFKGEPVSVNAENMAGSWVPDFYVYVIDKAPPTTGDEVTGLRGRVNSATVQETIEDRIQSMYYLADKDSPVVDEEKKIKKLIARHRTWSAEFRSTSGVIPMMVDVWSFSLADRDVSLLFTMMDQHYKKWSKTFYSVAKTFSTIEREEVATLDSASDYGELLSLYEEEVSRIPGWRVMPTDSQRFIIKTSSDNKKFLDAAIERLESSRDLFERDFPPSKAIEHVSVVRVCGTSEEFQQYGNTSGGVVGWFNPRSKELVLFDASEVDRKISYAVMTHEAFHQYCHFLFEESEAHRWFDEGHGDYYGAFKFKGGKAEVAARMPGGLDRLSVLRELLREGSWVPIKEHINFDHGQWQSRGVPSYAQSWSIVYMLRQGALGEVSRRVWKDEYADIIPNYMGKLFEGFQKEYAAQRAAAEAEAKVQGVEFDPEALELYVDRPKKNEIWKAAIADSWGKIDLDQFQEDWLEFCEKYLSD